MSSFKLNCLGEAKFVEENNNLDDKCQDTPDGSTGETLYQAPSSRSRWPVCLSLPYSYLFTADPNGNLEIQMQFSSEVVKKKS